MRRLQAVLSVLFLGLFLQTQVAAQETTDTLSQTEGVRFAAIRDNPAAYENQQVDIVGMVDRYVSPQSGDDSSVRFFYMRDAYGDALLVRTTAEMPDLRVLYHINGTVTRDVRGQLFVDEDNRRARPISDVEGFGRTNIEEPTVSPEAIATEPAGGDPFTDIFPIDEEGMPSWMIGLFILTGALLVALIYFVFKPAPKTATSGVSSAPFDAKPVAATPSAASTPSSTPAPPAGLPEPSSVIEDRTVKFYAPPPGTIKVLGGRFEVEKPEKNTIRFFSVPSPDGATVITFGRKPGKPYTHVQIKEPTVSSEQARIRIKDGIYEIENLSKTNPTLVNGDEVAEGGQKLKDRDTVEMGEVSFVFHT